MLRFLSRWRSWHLFATWSAYWLGLAAAVVTPIALAVHRASALGGPPDSTNLNLSFSSKAGFSVTVTHLTQQLYQGGAGLLAVGAAVSVPPLLLWGAWFYARERLMTAPPRAAELAEPVPDVGAEARDERRTARQ